MNKPPDRIPEGIQVLSLNLADGNMAVKINMRNEEGEQLYAVYSKDYIYQGELLTSHQSLFRRDFND